MGQSITLTTKDGHSLGAYRADPSGPAKGGIVVIQEIFGVNSHIRNLVDMFGGKGYAAIAPALFDRKQRDVELGYDEDGVTAGRSLRMCVGWDGPMADIAAAIEAVGGRRGAVGRLQLSESGRAMDPGLRPRHWSAPLEWSSLKVSA